MGRVNLEKRLETLAGPDMDGSDMERVADKSGLDLGDGGESEVLALGLDGDGLPEEWGEEGQEGLGDCDALDEVMRGQEDLDGIQ